jgi:prenyltransferase beta subunit
VKSIAVVALVALSFAGVVASSPGPTAAPAAFLVSRQASNGGFAEQGRSPDGPLTAWAALGLVAADGPAAARANALDFLRAHAGEAVNETDLALQVVALAALGDSPDELVGRLRSHRPGVLVNATIWSILGLTSVGQQPPSAFAKAVVAAQSRSGGWSWSRGGQPDSNDTAAAIQALTAVGIGATAVTRGIAALRAFQNPDGGFALTSGRESDAQSTAWAIQALLAAHRRPGSAAFRFLARMRRADGSYRYSARYGTTPVWVTAQVLPALAGRPFPF